MYTGDLSVIIVARRLDTSKYIANYDEIKATWKTIHMIYGKYKSRPEI